MNGRRGLDDVEMQIAFLPFLPNDYVPVIRAIPQTA